MTEERSENTNNKKNIFFWSIILGIIILIIGAIFYWIYISNKAYQEMMRVSHIQLPPIKFQTPAEVVEEFEKCLTEDYTQSLARLDQNDYRFISYKIAEALGRKDEQTCNELGEYKELCLGYLYRFLVLSTKDPFYIEKLRLIEDSNNYSIEDFLNNDPNVCNEIENILDKKTCQAMVTLNPTYCNFSSEDITLLKTQRKKYVRFELMDEEYAKDACLTGIYVKKAINERNPDYCLKAVRFTNLYCLAFLSTDYKKVIDKFFKENACYERYAFQMARIKNDKSFCEKIPFKDRQNKINYERCIEQFR